MVPTHHRKMLLLMLVLIALQAFTGCSDRPFGSGPKAEGGRMDLAQWQLEGNAFLLDGEWEFYWNQFLEPGGFPAGAAPGHILVPGTWNRYPASGKGDLGDGYATYRLIFTAAGNERSALKIPKVRTAYRLWVNGELRAWAGTASTARDSMIPQYLPQLALFQTRQGENEIVIQVSNFYERSGGILESITLGGEKRMLSLQYQGIANDLFLFGSLFVLGTYHLALFFFRRKNRSPLFFGLFCILVAIRTLLIGECFFFCLFPEFDWEVARKIQTLIFYSGVPFIILFFASAFPKYFHTLAVRMAVLIGAVFGMAVIFTSSRIFSVINPAYQVWTAVLIAYVAGMLLRIAFKEKGSWLIVSGGLVLLLTSLNDIIALNVWVNDNGFPLIKALFSRSNLSSAGQLVFAATNSLSLAKRFSDSLKKEEVMTAELTEMNAHLDGLVLKRTQALEELNEKIRQQKSELEKMNLELYQLSVKDSLTGLWNRRKYDETINLEWNRCKRHRRPIALMIMDVDYFKAYNDLYGHMAGDECLIRIGETLRRSLSRSTDMVARYGGEEFVLLLPETGEEEALQIAESIRRKMAELDIPQGESQAGGRITVSIGAACTVPAMDASHESLLQAADKALYRAKSAGRNQVKLLGI